MGVPTSRDRHVSTLEKGPRYPGVHSYLLDRFVADADDPTASRKVKKN